MNLYLLVRVHKSYDGNKTIEFEARISKYFIFLRQTLPQNYTRRCLLSEVVKLRYVYVHV